jgi:hypothetical protein
MSHMAHPTLKRHTGQHHSSNRQCDANVEGQRWGGEAIAQNVVKHPLVPDAASRGKLKARDSVKFTER